MGRFLGRIHLVGRRERFRHRGRIEVQRLGDASRDYLLELGWIPAHPESAYDSLTADLLQRIRNAFELAQGTANLRLHGDCHRGNVLWTDTGPHFVDLDDCLMGPAVQHLWMLLSGSRAEMAEQLSQLLEGYAQFAMFDLRELVLIESLRTLRMIHYSAWLARRWSDPAFPNAFPWFMEPRYWESQVLALREREFVTASRALDSSPWRILRRHILPHVSGIVLVYLTLTVPAIILYESFLRYLGLGIQPPLASWGTLIAEGA